MKNDPIGKRDYRGLYWSEVINITQSPAIHLPDRIIYGNTVSTWDVYAYPVDCEECPKKMIEADGALTIDMWYSDSVTREHEEEHINIAQTEWGFFKSGANSYLNSCVSPLKALCYKEVVYLLQSYYQAVENLQSLGFDCLTGDYEACGKITEAQVKEVEKLMAVDSKITECAAEE